MFYSVVQDLSTNANYYHYCTGACKQICADEPTCTGVTLKQLNAYNVHCRYSTTAGLVETSLVASATSPDSNVATYLKSEFNENYCEFYLPTVLPEDKMSLAYPPLFSERQNFFHDIHSNFC